jgi:hypothetical protein
MTPILVAVAVLLPLDPGADQAALGSLLSRPGAAALTYSNMESVPVVVSDWAHGDCESRFRAKLPDGQIVEPVIHWGSGQLVLLDAFDELSFWGLDVTGADGVTGFRLQLTDAERVQATRTLRRLNAACTPQR